MTNNGKQRGGKREGAGRKPIKVEENVKAGILKAIAKDPGCVDRVWANVIAKAEKGSYPHANLFLNYFYGKPVETVNVSQKQLILKSIIVHE